MGKEKKKIEEEKKKAEEEKKETLIKTPAEEKIKIIIQTLDKNEYPFEVQLSWRIGQLKNRIQKKLQLGKVKKVIHNGKVIKPNKTTLAEINVQENDHVVIITKKVKQNTEGEVEKKKNITGEEEKNKKKEEEQKKEEERKNQEEKERKKKKKKKKRGEKKKKKKKKK